MLRRGCGNECAGTRTQDLRIKSPLLYQLSYALFVLIARKFGLSHELACRRSLKAGEGAR